MAAELPALIHVEVCYALPQQQWRIRLELAEGTTVGDALDASGIAARVPAVDIADAALGIFSQPCTRTTPLRDGDRVEIYRPLQCDPKDVRRRRAARAPSKRRG